MTTTYNTAALTTNPIYQVRFNIGDRDVTAAQLTDEEIAWALYSRGSVMGACAMCCLALAAEYSRLTSISADGVSQGLNQKSAQYAAMAAAFQKKEAIYRASPTLGGVSKADMLAVLSNTDRVPDIFRIGITDDPPSDGVDPFNSPPIGVELPSS